jgi:hypothetical protein
MTRPLAAGAARIFPNRISSRARTSCGNTEGIATGRLCAPKTFVIWGLSAASRVIDEW